MLDGRLFPGRHHPIQKVKLWWPAGRPIHELKLNFSSWTLTVKKRQVELLDTTSAHWYYVCKKQENGNAVQAVARRWELSNAQARQVISTVWHFRLAPKLRTFLWLVALQALPTIERKFDWLYDLGATLCSRCQECALVSLPHVLITCPAAQCIWREMAQKIGSCWGTPVTLTPQFLLHNTPQNEAERRLRNLDGWQTWRAWTLYVCWVEWTSFFYGCKQETPALALAQRAWTKAAQASKLAWLAKREDPVKGRPPPHNFLVEIGMVARNEQVGRQVWNFVLPVELHRQIGRNQAVWH